MKGVLVATVFLTRVPMPVSVNAGDIQQATRWFPLIGAAIGAAGALTAWTLAVLALPGTLTAIVLVALGAWVTGAIHLDGLADTADGFGGGTDRETTLRIMRDPVIGSFGAIALILVVALKVAALAALLDRNAARPSLVAAPALARWTVALLGAWMPYARPAGGLGEAATRQTRGSVLVATALAMLVTIAALGIDGFVAATVAPLTVAWIGRMARRRIGGVTGDVFGAAVELTETAVLLSGVIVAGHA